MRNHGSLKLNLERYILAMLKLRPFDIEQIWPLTPIAQACQRWLKEEYGTDLQSAQAVRFAQFRQILSPPPQHKDEPDVGSR